MESFPYLLGEKKDCSHITGWQSSPQPQRVTATCITKVLFTACPFPQHMMSNYQEEIHKAHQKENKRKEETRFEETGETYNQTGQECWNYQTRSWKQLQLKGKGSNG